MSLLHLIKFKSINGQSCQPLSIKMRIFSTENEDFDTKMRNFN